MNVFNDFITDIKIFGLEKVTGRFYGVYRGIVTDNRDTAKRCRLRVDIPTINNFKDYEYWAESANTPSGTSYVYDIPKVGENVWLVFEGGDLRYPIWSHGLFQSAVKGNFDPNKTTALVTPLGEISFNDKMITVKVDGGGAIELTKDTVTVNAKKVKLSGGGVTEKSVKGETLEKVLSQLLTVLQAATTIDGKPLNPLTVQGLTAVKGSLISITSNIVENE